MPPRRHRQCPQPTDRQHDVTVLEQPDSSLCDERFDFKGVDRGPAQRGNQIRFDLFVQMANAQSLKGELLMVV